MTAVNLELGYLANYEHYLDPIVWWTGNRCLLQHSVGCQAEGCLYQSVLCCPQMHKGYCSSKVLFSRVKMVLLDN